MKRLVLAAAFALPLLAACSPRSVATKVVANAIAQSPTGGVYAQDDDPEFVRAAIPFGLKTMEALLAEHPDHVGLLTSLAGGFAQFSYAFVEFDADDAELRGQNAAALAGYARAKRLYLRAREYGLRGLEARHEGLAARLRSVRDLDAALAVLEKDDVPLAYWTAAAWALAIDKAKQDMSLVAELPVPGALIRRALALDEAWDEGALHEFLVTWEASKGGPDGMTRAREHFDRAVALAKGKRLGVFVAYAESVLVPRQDRAEFTRVLQQVLAADVDADKPHRLGNVLAQRRARMLLAHLDDLFA